MTNKERYQKMENEIHVPSEVLGKVMNMKNNNLKKRNILKCAVSIAASFAAVFIVTNGICYAATGDTWVEKATVYINGEPKEVDIQYQQDEDGTTGTVTLDLGDDTEETNVEVLFDEDSETDTVALDINEDTDGFNCEVRLEKESEEEEK